MNIAFDKTKSRGLLGLTLGLIVLITGFWLLFRPPALPVFAEIDDVPEMKQAFANYLSPIINAENQRIQNRRQNLDAIALELKSTGDIGFWKRWQLHSLADDYEVEWSGDELEQVIAALKLRVDSIPVDLALAQAAKESGWGRSRFAVEGNNLFGLWCYKPGCGIVPKNRPAGAKHEVASFSSVADAVAYYIHNINTHDGYRELRRLRLRQREAGRTPDPVTLAQGLLLYSERREAYVEEVQAMVRQFQRINRTATAL